MPELTTTTYCFIALAVYCLAILGLSFAQSRSESTADFLIGNRETGFWSLLFSLNSTWMNAAWILFVLTLLATDIWAYIWIYVGNTIALLCLWALAGKIRKITGEIKACSIAEYAEKIFGSFSAKAIGIQTFLVYVVWLMLEINAGSLLISTLFDISYAYTVMGIGAFVFLYLYWGGFKILIATDRIQFFCALFFFVALLMVFKQPDAGFSLSNIIAPTDSTNFNGALVGFVSIFPAIFFGAEIWQRIMAADTVKTAGKLIPWLMITNITIYIPVFLLVFFMPGAQGLETGEALLQNAFSLMPDLLLPFVIVAFFALLMSTVDSVSFLAGQALINDGASKIIKPLAKWHPENQLRLGLLICITAACVAALFFTNILENVYFIMTLWMVLSPIVLPLIFNRKFSDWGVGLTISVGLLTIIGAQISGLYNDYVGLGVFFGGFILPFIIDFIKPVKDVKHVA